MGKIPVQQLAKMMVESDLADARPELTVDVDREKAALFGLSTQKIGWTVRSAINGTEASEFRDAESWIAFAKPLQPVAIPLVGV